MTKILIVEDEETVLELVSEIFSRIGGYQVFCAKEGAEAITIARREKPDIILLDVQIPVVNGYEVCKTLKSDPDTAHIKIVMLTGMVQEANWEKARECGADDHIGKPFRPAALISKVEETMKPR
jgi:CheY-like chemotaxis protein